MRVATWNINNRAGKTRFRPEAARAAAAVGADLIAITEFYPQQNEAAFRDALAEGGLPHQIASVGAAGANRVLVACRTPIAPYDLAVPPIDDHLSANVLGVRVRSPDLVVVALRVPWYVGDDMPLLAKAWDWFSTVASLHRDRPCVALGDFNVSVTSRTRGAVEFKSILANGWHRISAGPTFPDGVGGGSEIDHILATERCSLENPAALLRAGEFELAGSAQAISDHAALACDVRVRDA